VSLVYLVDARDGRRADKDLQKARSSEPRARFFLLTWQVLHRTLNGGAARASLDRDPSLGTDYAGLWSDEPLQPSWECFVSHASGLAAVVEPVRAEGFADEPEVRLLSRLCRP